MSNISILVSCHKPVEVVPSEIIKPIQVGCALNEKRFKGMLRDNEGENISAKNPNYCELTAQYWAWKNLDADYYGFFHYRRYMNFSKEKYLLDCWKNVCEEFLDKKSVKKYKIDDETMRREIEGYDLVITEEKDITKMPVNDRTVYDQYKNGNQLHVKDLDIMREVVKEKYPEYVDDMESYLKGKMTCLCNMYIMKKDLFQEYAAWLFDILGECEKRMDMSDYSIEALRTPGHLAERLLSIFYFHVKRTRNLKIKTLQTVVFFNTDPVVHLKPAYAENNNAVVLSANEYYVPYLAAVLESIRANSNDDQNYDLIIMHRDISMGSQDRLKKQLEDHQNITLRFLDIRRYEKPFKKLFLRGHFALETYFRLLMPQILADYDKAVYIDSDLVVNADIAELYATDVDGYLLAAAKDADTAGLYNGFEPNKKKYMDTILKIKKPYEYFQAGVIVFNLAEFRKTYTTAEMLKFAASYEWELLDQDVLNYLAQGRVKFVDMAWNVMVDWRGIRLSQIIALAPKYLHDEHMEARKNPKIIHYAGPDKPWHQPWSDMAEEFWKYSRNTVFYETIMQRMCDPEGSRVGIKQKIRDHVVEVGEKVFPKDTARREVAKKIIIKTIGGI